jgi:formylmethanofuran dehydrogenase subunit E
MLDMAKGLKDIHDANVRNRAIIELQQQILDAQAEQSSLLERLRTRENELAEIRAWQAERQRYRLEELPPGVFVYTLKPEMAAAEPMHHICKTCYERDHKSILDKMGEPSNGVYHLKCRECGTTLQIGRRIRSGSRQIKSGGPYSWMGA